MILDVPAVIGGKLLDSWLSLKCLCKIDSAFCSELSRKAYLFLMSQHAIINAVIDSEWVGSLTVIKWMLLRNVRAYCVHIPCGANEEIEILKEFFERSGPSIKKLSIYSPNSALLDILSHNCINLEDFSCEKCTMKNRESFGKFLSGCRKLKHLELFSFGYMENPLVETVARVVDKTFISLKLPHSLYPERSVLMITPLCPNLICLDFSQNQVCDSTVKQIVQQCPLLQDLNLCEYKCWSNLTDDGLSSVAELLHLRTLDLSYSNRITDQGITYLVQRNPHLRKLYIGCITKLTNVSLYAIANNCSNLTHLEVTGCEKMTNKGVVDVVTKCARLEILHLELTRRITKAAMEKLGDIVKILNDNEA